MKEVEMKVTCAHTMAQVAFSLVLEDVSFSYDADNLILKFQLTDLRWLFGHLVNMKYKEIDYILCEEVKYNYMGEEL